jgi:hypothetical protein
LQEKRKEPSAMCKKYDNQFHESQASELDQVYYVEKNPPDKTGI